jgi:hypothetical protein
MCFDSAASQCEIQWHSLDGTANARQYQYRLSNWALYRLFLSGLTILHLASSPTTVPLIDTARASRALVNCRDSLGVFIRHLPAMKAYEDTFRDLVDAWQSKGRVSADSVHAARMHASGPGAQQHVRMGSHGAAEQWFGMGGGSGAGTGVPTPTGQGYAQFGNSSGGGGSALSTSPTMAHGGNANANTNARGFDAYAMSVATPIGQGGQSFGSAGGSLPLAGSFGNQGQGQGQGQFGGPGGPGSGGIGLSTPGFAAPMVDDLAGKPGAGMRDEFSS